MSRLRICHELARHLDKIIITFDYQLLTFINSVIEIGYEREAEESAPRKQPTLPA
jgi:hypothetical protein